MLHCAWFPERKARLLIHAFVGYVFFLRKDEEERKIMIGNITVLIVGYLLFSTGISSIVRLDCLLYGDFELIYFEKHYQGNLAKTIHNLSLDECALHCVTYNVCTSFNYNVTNRDCFLLSGETNGEIDLEKLVDRPGSLFASTDYNTLLVRKIYLHCEGAATGGVL